MSRQKRCATLMNPFALILYLFTLGNALRLPVVSAFKSRPRCLFGPHGKLTDKQRELFAGLPSQLPPTPLILFAIMIWWGRGCRYAAALFFLCTVGFTFALVHLLMPLSCSPRFFSPSRIGMATTLQHLPNNDCIRFKNYVYLEYGCLWPT